MSRLPSTGRLAAALLFVLLASALGLPARAGGVAPFAAELALVVLGIALALRAAQDALGEPRDAGALRVAAVLLILLGVGQLVRSKKTFPIVPYTMYGRAAEGAAVFYTYEARKRSGERARFEVSTVFASLGNARIVKGLARALDDIAALDAAGKDSRASRTRLNDAMSALIARHNQDHASDPVVQVDALQVALPPPFHPGDARRHAVMSFVVGAAP